MKTKLTIIITLSIIIIIGTGIYISSLSETWINNNSNIKVDKVLNNIKNKKHIENVNNIVNKEWWQNRLNDIENEINKENTKKEKAYNEKINTIKNNVSEYFQAINKDLDIIKYIDPESISIIQDHTWKVYKTFNNKEKKDFIDELKWYGYSKNTFDATNSKDINEYINFIIKWGFKQFWNIKEIKFNKFNEISKDITFVDVNIVYENKKEKNNRLFINNKNWKLIINN